jgi:hypothetical protein
MNTNTQMIYEGMVEALTFTDCHDDTEDYTDDTTLSDELLDKLKAYAEKFYTFEGVAELVEDFCSEEELNYIRVGNIVWYACQGHGCGFFDYSGEAAKKLNAMFDDWRKWYLNNPYIGSNGQMYI